MKDKWKKEGAKGKTLFSLHCILPSAASTTSHFICNVIHVYRSIYWWKHDVIENYMLIRTNPAETHSGMVKTTALSLPMTCHTT